MINHYKNGYYDGWRQLTFNDYYGNNWYEYAQYQKGYDKGFNNKEFCEAYSDEAMGVAGYGP